MSSYENDYSTLESLLSSQLSQAIQSSEGTQVDQQETGLQLNNLPIVEFYYDFSGFLPESLFHRILTRASNWTLLKKGADVQTAVKLYRRKARFYLDQYHI